MATSEDIAGRYLQIKDERFYAFGEADSNAIYERFRFSGEDFLGLALAMPATIDLPAKNRVPAVVFHQRDALRVWDMDAYDNMAVIAVSRGTGEVFAGRAQYNEKRETMRKKPVRAPGPRPTGDSAAAKHYGVLAIDLLERTSMPQTQDSYVVRALEFDWVSNAVNVQVNAAPPPAATPIETSGKDSAQFRKTSLAPPADGLVLVAPSSAAVGAANTMVSGSGKIALPASATLLPGPTPDGVRAWVRAALLVAPKNDTPPAIVELTLPVFGSAPVKAGDSVEIYFTQSIAEYLGAAGVDHRVYWVLDRYISAALPLKAAEQ